MGLEQTFEFIKNARVLLCREIHEGRQGGQRLGSSHLLERLVDQPGRQSLTGQPGAIDVGVALLLAFENILAVEPF